MLPGVATLHDPLPLGGKKTSEAFEKVFGIRTVGDLLRHYPRRYYTRGELTPLAELREGDHATVLARVESATLAQYSRSRFPNGGRKTTDRAEVTVTDGTATLTLTFFGGAGHHVRVLQRGKIGLFAGTVSTFRGRRQLVHPEYELLPVEAVDAETTAEAAAEYATELIPVYPASARLSSWHISKAVQGVLNTLDIGEDPLPEDVRQQHDLWPREMAIRAIHRPQDRSDLQRARKRLKWDEAFVMQAALAQRRVAAAAMPAMPRPPEPDGIAAEFDRRLPFTLTEGQRFVGEVIARDLSCAYPMNRLLQGEVGSGKTVVAVRAMLQV
ncbi:MAG TPA: ATP-dependent DNA helicase RecG, partial [Trebonia sp.]|nr:ATP-dependent DNA helicase RecG [Trebonia sp.]